MAKSISPWRKQTLDGDLTLYGVFCIYTQEIASHWGWNEQTLAQYLSNLVNTIIPCIDDHNSRPINLYTPEFIDDIVKRIETLGYQKSETGYAPETLNRFRHIMSVTLRTAVAHMLCPDPWKQHNSVIPSKRSSSQAKPVRYFTPSDELRVIRYITENAYKVGEMRGLYVMLCTRCRENEAAGLTWEMIRDSEADPQLLTISIMQTTQLTSTLSKLGGKTANAPRQITLTADQSAFIRSLRDFQEEKWIKKGGKSSDFPKSRVATRKNKPTAPCRARHLSDAANAMFAELHLSDKFENVSRRLALKAIEHVENPDYEDIAPETSATCYTLRRAAATFDRVLGIDMQDRQYLMGHAVSNAAHTHIFRDAQHQCVLAQKSADRPGLNKIYTPTSKLDGVLELRGSYCNTVLASHKNGRITGMVFTDEPGDHLQIKLHSSVPCKLIVKTGVQDPQSEYSWEVNVKRKLHEMYKKPEEEDGNSASRSR